MISNVIIFFILINQYYYNHVYNLVKMEFSENISWEQADGTDCHGAKVVPVQTRDARPGIVVG